MRNLSKTLPLSIGLLFCCFFTSFGQNIKPIAKDTNLYLTHNEYYSIISEFLPQFVSNHESGFLYQLVSTTATEVAIRGYYADYTPDFQKKTEKIVWRVINPLDTNLRDTAELVYHLINLPLIAIDDEYNVSQNKHTNFYPLNNDYDPEEVRLQPETNCFLKILKNPIHGTIGLSNNNYYYTISYTPNKDFKGKDSLTYLLCDSYGQCDTGVIRINVTNQAPVANDKNYDIAYAKATFNFSDIVDDEDDNLDLHSYKILTPPQKGSAHIVIDEDEESILEYFPPKGKSAFIDNISYSVCDFGGLCDTGLIILNVAENGAPITGENRIYAAYLEKVSTNLYSRFLMIDPENDLNLNSFKLIKAPKYCDFNLDSTGLYTAFFKTQNVKDTVTYSICDNGGLCTEGFIYIQVDPNKAPQLYDKAYSISKNYEFTGYLYLFDVESNLDSNAINLLKPAKHGSLKWLRNNASSDLNFIYKPYTNFIGVDTIHYKVCDTEGLCDSAYLVIDVKDNVPPTAVDDIIQMESNYSVQGDAQNNDFDIDYNLDPQSFRIVRYPKQGQFSMSWTGSFQLSLNNILEYPDTVSYQVCDNLGLCDTAKIIFRPKGHTDNSTGTGDYPNSRIIIIKTPKNTAFMSNNLFKPSGNISSANFLCIPEHGTATLNNDTVLTYIPLSNFIGLDTVCVQVCNNEGLCDTTIFYISVVENSNEAPNANDDSLTLAKNTTVTVNFLANDSDNGSPIIFADLIYIEKGNAILNSNNTITYMPPKDFVGNSRVDYSICNTNGCDTVSIYFTITDDINNPIKHAPVATNDYFVTDENVPLSNTVASNDFDEDNDLKINSFKVLKTSKNGVLILKEEGSFLYTPAQSFLGSDTASYTVCDTTGLCDTAWIFISVQKLYHHPTLGQDNFTNLFNTALKGSVALNDSDIDNDLNKMSYVIASNPNNGSVKLSNDGNFIYLPNYNFVGIDTFYYQACDTKNLCSQAICIVTTQASYIAGKVYIDENSDGIQNVSESILPNVYIRINDKTAVFTDANGYYQILVDTSKSYTLKPAFNTSVYKFYPLSKTVISSNNFGQSIENQDFMLRPIKAVNDLVMSVEQGNARPGFQSESILTYTNKGTSTISGTLNIKLDNYLSFITSNTEPTIINGHMITWHFADLKPFESHNINISIKTAVNSPLNYSTKIDYNGLLGSGLDIDTINNKGISSMQVRGSFDPNDISVDVTEVKQTGTIKESVIPLTYKIRFQNTGNAEAYKVEVIDTLSEKLDISSLEILSASHPFEMKIVSDSSNQTVVKWIFDNINLVDSTTKEACSHGFIKYRINNFKDKTNYSKDSILNKAAIYFDFNEPVLTNIATTIFTFSTPIREINNLSFQVYPNPTSDWVNITCEKNVEAIIELSNLYGQVIQHQILRGSNGQINLADLQNGIYILTIKNGEKQGTVKILKQ